jgi:cell division protein FtsB
MTMQWLLFLLCPIMMILMMRGMHSGSHNEKDDEQLKQDLENLKEQNDILSSELSDLKSRLK